MVSSVNTNTGALVALQSLNNTSDRLQTVQKRVSTGFKVADAVGDQAAFAVAQSIRSERSYDSINRNLSEAKGGVEVGLAAAENIAATLSQAREALTKLADSELSADARATYAKEYSDLRAYATRSVDGAQRGGANALGDSTQKVVTGGTAIGGYNLKAALETLPTEVTTAEEAKAVLTDNGTGESVFSGVERAVGNAVNGLGADSRQLGAQIQFSSSMQEGRSESLGAIVDADLARGSAQLQALQVRQQLGAQTLGIANHAPQTLQNLFR